MVLAKPQDMEPRSFEIIIMYIFINPFRWARVDTYVCINLFRTIYDTVACKHMHMFTRMHASHVISIHLHVVLKHKLSFLKVLGV